MVKEENRMAPRFPASIIRRNATFEQRSCFTMIQDGYKRDFRASQVAGRAGQVVENQVRLLTTDTSLWANISAMTPRAPHQTRVSKSRSELPSRPMHALRNASSALRWRPRLLTTSVPGLTSGALSIYERSESTEYSGANSPEADASRYLTRVSSSVRIVRSRMSGVASRESCHAR